MSDVMLSFRGFGDRPPPFLDVMFDVEVVNPVTAPLWFLLPLYLDERAELGPLLASSVEVSELSGTGRVRLARFLGNGSFQAMRIAAGARVTVRGLPVTLVGAPPESHLIVPLMTADSLRIGDQPAEDWFTIDLPPSPTGDVTYEPGAIVASQDTPAVQAIRIAMTGVRAWALRVALKT